MKILVTGGTGMVGTYLKKVATCEHDWVFVSSKMYDLINPDAVDEMFSSIKPDMIIHLAAVVGGIYKNMKEKVKMFHDNVIMNENVLHFANKHNVQYGIFCVSTCVFPANPKAFPMTEDMIVDGLPHSSNDAYAYAKRMMYVQCKNYNNECGRKYMCVAPCNIYGKYDNYNLVDGHVVPALLHKFYIALKSGEKLIIPTGANSMRQFIYAKDLAKVMVRMVENIDTLTFDNLIVANDEVRIVDIIHQIAACFPGVQYEIIEKEEGIAKKTCSNRLLMETFPDLTFLDMNHKLKKSAEWFVNNYETARK